MFDLRYLKSLLFFDAETVYGQKDYDKLSPLLKKHWERRARQLRDYDPEDPRPEELYYNQAAIHAEFGRVVCISFGMLTDTPEGLGFRVKSFASADEAEVLSRFAGQLTVTGMPKVLCGHNIKNFDIPYLLRRMLVHQIQIPPTLQILGKKPWEIPHLDTMEVWKFGDFRSFAPLELLTELFGVPSPKEAMDGAHVSTTFWESGDLTRIATYCEADVLATAQLLLRLSYREMIPQERIEHAGISEG